ncbi:DMT family transporter [Chitinispirillales bacterium ANBcel5]|uniref:DMT family transporter n=1 Tax=Cellulosispirillum alkaliphilum TaxID=3039283 RepID=UPI002A516300|nr:DMT family transporter [Chitinispirillales bacterium ANBcel5]
MSLHSKQTNFWLITCFVFLWNSGFIGAEYGLPYARTFTLLFYRYLALTVLIFLYLNLRKRFIWVGWGYARNQMLIGVLAHGVWLSCVLIAVEYGVPSGIVALVVALQPLATGALSGVVVGERTSWNQWLGLIVGFLGVAFTVVARINFHDSAEVFAWFIPLGSVIAITAASLFQRKLSLKKEYSTVSKGVSLFYQSLATTVAVIVPAIVVERLSVEWSPVFVSALLWLVVAVSLGAYIVMWVLIDRIDATKVASLFYLGPPVTMLMTWIAFGDTVQITDLMGLAIVFVGVLVTYLRYPVISKPKTVRYRR